MFLACANGLFGRPKAITQEAPNGAINKPQSLDVSPISPIHNMVSAAAKPEVRAKVCFRKINSKGKQLGLPKSKQSCLLMQLKREVI